MKLVRRSYERAVYEYVCEVNERFIHEINIDLGKYAVGGISGMPEITEDLIGRVFNHDTTAEDNEITYQVRDFNGGNFTVSLVDQIQDYLSDMIWDCDSEIVDGGSIDYEDFVEE